MMKRMRSGLLTLSVLLAVFSNVAGAQCTGHMAIVRFEFLQEVNPQAACVYLAPSSIFGDYLVACWLTTCTASDWCPTCNHHASQPINLTNGNTFIQQNDLRIPGLGGGLALERTWNSIWPTALTPFQVGMFGANWRSTYEERVFTGSGAYSGYMLYLQPDGGMWVFSPNGSTWSLKSPANLVVTLALTQNGTQWTMTFQNGDKKNFSYTSGSLTSIVDRNGNTTTLAYDGSNRLVTVTDPASRTLTFTYGGTFPNVVTGVSSSVGISLSYAYDTQGRLVQVTKPDSTTVSFAYDAQSLISAVTDSQGKLLESHTYDNQGRGLTSSQANGVDGVTISYPQ